MEKKTLLEMEKKILLVEKVTNLEYHQAKGNPKFRRRHEEKMIKLLRDHKRHNEFTGKLVKILDTSGADFDRHKADKIENIDYANYSMILTSGGDGTFLKAAENINGQTIVGMNSTYSGSNEGSAGGLTIIDKRNLYEIRRIFTGDYRLEEWRRLYASINGRKIDDLAVNDIYVGHPKSYKSSHLEVIIEPEGESFVSSGAVFSTGMGSHAWFRSAGGTQFKNELDLFGIIIREPFEKKEKYKFTSRILSEKEKVVIYPERDDYVVVFDSKDKEYSIATEDYVTIGLSDRSINVVRFD